MRVVLVPWSRLSASIMEHLSLTIARLIWKAGNTLGLMSRKHGAALTTVWDVKAPHKLATMGLTAMPATVTGPLAGRTRRKSIAATVKRGHAPDTALHPCRPRLAKSGSE